MLLASCITLFASSIVELASKTSSSVELAFGACYIKLHHITRHSKIPQKGEDLEDLGLDDISDRRDCAELGCGGPIPAGGSGLGVVGPFFRK